MSPRRRTIKRLHEEGNPIRAIAEALGLTPNTVVYHLNRLQSEPAVQPIRELPRAVADGVMTTPHTRERVRELLGSGLTRAEIARVLAISKATVTYHARRLGEPIQEQCARRYDWDAIQSYYDEGHGVRECIAAFGFSSASWAEAVKRGDIAPRPSATPLAELLVAGTYRGRTNLKARLLKEGLKTPSCETCGIDSWLGTPLSLALHHVNGDRLDNRLENLRLLCPNCHSQTNNFSGRNGRGGPKG